MKHRSGNPPGKVLAIIEERKAKIKELPTTSFAPRRIAVQGGKTTSSVLPNTISDTSTNSNHTKYQLLAAIGIIWKRYPYLKLGELLTYAIGNNLSEVEDFVLQKALINFDPKYIDAPICAKLSSYIPTYCSLHMDHVEEIHYNESDNEFFHR